VNQVWGRRTAGGCLRPLGDIVVLDFSTLLPGPLATLMLAEAGAKVITIERPGAEEMSALAPLNRGKKRVVLDLKNPDHRDELRPLLERADVLVEQFRPGVMRRLGLGYDEVAEINPKIVYCSITGYGQDGPRSSVAGHDINYIAETGLLSLSMGTPDNPVIPPALIADIAGGSYPAVINILLALRDRERTRRGRHLDVSMTDNLFTLMLGSSVITSASPRYRLYPTKDGRMLAVGALEQRFWDTFCDITALDEELRDETVNPEATASRLGEIIASETADTWRSRIADRDCCCSIVATVAEAARDPHFTARGLSAPCVPIDRQFRDHL
jgi:crotonobetainyl-CoA:carnitine CoA-transferase CaiB-like acyl-CoA transferase